MGAVLFPPGQDDGGRYALLRSLLGSLGVEVIEISVLPCSEALRPLVSIVPAQRLAAELARLTGGDPDESRNIAYPPAGAAFRAGRNAPWPRRGSRPRRRLRP